MAFYRVKIRLRAPGKPAPPAKERSKVRELIAKHGGKDVSRESPNAAFAVGVFKDRAAAKAFRDEARAARPGR